MRGRLFGVGAEAVVVRVLAAKRTWFGSRAGAVLCRAGVVARLGGARLLFGGLPAG